MMVDQPAANAAAVGSSHKDATLLVTRGLLDTLNRDETLAIVARSLASVGNGDFAVMRSLLAVFQVKGFFLTLLDLPFRRSAWVALYRLIAAILGSVHYWDSVIRRDQRPSWLEDQGPQAVRAAYDVGAPDIVAGQVDMFPAEW